MLLNPDKEINTENPSFCHLNILVWFNLFAIWFLTLERVKKVFFSKHLNIWNFFNLLTVKSFFSSNIWTFEHLMEAAERHWAVAHYRCNQEAGVSTVRSQQIQDYNTRTKTKYKYKTNEITQCQLHQEEKITLKPRPKCENCTKRSFFPDQGKNFRPREVFPDQGKFFSTKGSK